jgi:hypothetical protein
VIELIGYSVPSQIPPKQDDAHSLGVVINFMRHPNQNPFSWLSEAQFAMVSLLSAVGDIAAINRLSNEGDHNSGNVYGRENPAVDPIEKLVHRCTSGNTTVDELRDSIKQYIIWRDNQMDNTSVEEEVKAVFGKFSSLVQSGQQAVRSAFKNHNDFW